MQQTILFWQFYNFFGLVNGISLEEHDFLRFVYFWDSLRSHFPIFHIGLGEFKRNLMQIKSALAAAAMAVRFLTPWRYPIINAFIGISFYYIAESMITEIDPCQD